MKDAVHEFDLIIRGGRVVDGTGAPAFAADVGICGDRIAAIGDLSKAEAGQEIAAVGLVVAPGFIDVHTHDDLALLDDPSMLAKITQGVTSVITGNCGISLAPLQSEAPPAPLDIFAQGGNSPFRFPTFAAYVAGLEKRPAAVNAALMVGHSTLRAGNMSDVGRPATDGEIETMRANLEEALDAGAIGFSTGLFYPAARAAPPAEIDALLPTVARAGAVYTTHMRDEGDHVVASIEESLAAAKLAGVRLIISHHKCMGRRNFGRSRETLALIETAARDQDVAFDAYPYEAGSSVLLAELAAVADRTVIGWSAPHPEMAGRDLAEVTEQWDVDLAAAVARLSPGGGIYHVMDEADVMRIISHPDCMIGSDGLPHDRFPHPRLWGTFPRVIGTLSRDRGLFPMEDAVRRMTSVPADRFNLRERGAVRPGYHADLTIFDPLTIRDRATFEEPMRPAAGVEGVVVNGVSVLERGRPTGRKPGRVLKRS